MLPEITPENLGELLGVQRMPPHDFSIVNQNNYSFDMNRLGIIDIFLAVIAKSLHLQVKVKTMTTTLINKVPQTVKLCNCIDLNISNLKNISQVDDGGGVGLTLNDKILDSVNTVESTKEVVDRLFEFDIKGIEDNTNLNDEFDVIRKKPKLNEKNLNQRWFFKGVISIKQAENIIGLIRDMTSVSISLSTILH